jgi:flagellar hook-length control protein FliK
MPTERSPIDLPDDGEAVPAVAVSVESPASRPKRAVGKNNPAFFPVPPKPAKADAGAAPAVAIRARVGTESIPARSETPALVVPGNAPQQATPVAASPTFSSRPEGTQPVQPAPVGVPSTGDMLVADTPASPRASARTDSAPSVQPPQASPAPAALQPVAPAPAQPAGIVFGFALAGIFGQRQPADPTDRSAPRDQALQALTAAAGSAQAVGAVAGTGDPRHAALDMRRDDWPQAMIDRIEALRDSADAADTRIRLIPDALGKVDVSLRHDGDAVHVHFAAEIAATRALLADAQSRLADAAQARGLRLGQATVDAGSGQAGRQPQQQPAAPTPLPARPAPAAIADTDAHPESSRLA